MRCIGFVLGLLLPALAGSYSIGHVRSVDLAPRTLLVADSRMDDPRFARSVILLVEYGEQGAWGVVLNKPSRRRLADVLEEPGVFSERDDRLFWGGPVGSDKPFILVETSRQPSPRAKEVGDGLYMSGSAKLLTKLAEEAENARPFRVFQGYAGWGVGQLDREYRAGDWHVVPLSAAPLLETDPDHLWRDLIEAKGMKLVRRGGDRHKPLDDFGTRFGNDEHVGITYRPNQRAGFSTESPQ